MGKRLAICIGVNHYVNASHVDLRYARSDAEALCGVLADPLRGGFDEVSVLLDDQATKLVIRHTIDAVLLAPDRQSDDLVLVFFSGHGTRDRQNDLCLVPSDFRYHNDGSLDYASMVHTKEIEVSIGNSNVKNIIFLIDSCHSGALGKLIGRTWLQDDTNLFILGAARASETAVETSSLSHGVFTECLLRSLNLAPDRGEWITLGAVTSFVSAEIDKFLTSQLVQTTSHYVSSAIGLARNPAYSPVSREFTQEVMRTYELAGYEIELATAVGGYPNFFMANIRAGFRASRTGVMCFDNKRVRLTPTHMDQAVSLIQQLYVDREISSGALVTASDLPPKLQQRVNTEPILTYSTNGALLRSIIDFTLYLHRLVDQFDKAGYERPEEPALADYYVDLLAEVPDDSGHPRWRGQAIFFIETWLERPDWIEAWLEEPDLSRLALLGEYGSGKTTISRKLARDLAEKYLHAEVKASQRIPVLIPLQDFPRGQADMETFITGHLARRCGVRNASYDAFRAMNDAGLLVLIFDGFDEMAVHVDEDVILANLRQIEQFALAPKGKIILTSRPEYFKTSREEQEALSRRSKYERLYLLPFQSDQIAEFLQKRIPTIPEATEDWAYYVDEIERIHDLRDLSRRPVLLEMIVRTLPKLVASGMTVDRPTLYHTYLVGELQRQSVEKRRELLIKREDRLRMMETLALYYYLEKPSGLTADHIQILVHDQLSPQQRAELEAHTRDFLTCSFLVRQGDMYAFSHRSLLEYLSAKRLYALIAQGDSREFAKHELTKEIVDFLVEMTPDRARLRGWIQDTRGRLFTTVQYLGGNALTLLARLGEDLRGVDLAGTLLRGADLRQADLSGAILTRADLSYSKLSNAILTGCNFTEVDFTRANLSDAEARRCRFVSACLDETDLNRADLSDSDFTGCLCSNSNFADVLADGCLGATSLYEGAVNPSASLKLAALGIEGYWTNGKISLEVVSTGLGTIQGILSFRRTVAQVEFTGSLFAGEYKCEGKLTLRSRALGARYYGSIRPAREDELGVEIHFLLDSVTKGVRSALKKELGCGVNAVQVASTTLARGGITAGDTAQKPSEEVVTHPSARLAPGGRGGRPAETGLIRKRAHKQHTVTPQS